ncbi:MAG TPA: hypothetical protein VNW89_17255 [Stellaceae bacterium]|nr:hypothetical protein [Stellaceae bacterium]
MRKDSPGKAIVWLEKARSANAAHPLIRGHLAAAYGRKGESELAPTAELAEARRVSPDGHYMSIARVKAGYFGVPSVRALYEATYFDGLRKAGMPED